jgi:hypothetical protein
MAPQRAGASFFSAQARILIPQRENRFGPSYLFSKSLKFFKLLDQCLHLKTQGKRRTIGDLNAVTQRTLLSYITKKAD